MTVRTVEEANRIRTWLFGEIYLDKKQLTATITAQDRTPSFEIIFENPFGASGIIEFA